MAFVCACTPEIPNDTDVPEVAEFDPVTRKVAEPSFLVINPATGRIDLGLAGIDVPASCDPKQLPPELVANCEFGQYLESLDGFPTTTAARAPFSAPLDPATLTPQNVAVIDSIRGVRVDDVQIGPDPTGPALVVAPKAPWRTGGFVWIGVRGYHSGVRAGGKPVVAPLAYNLLRRDEPLTCAAPCAGDPAAILDTCPYLQLLSAQMEPMAARASLAQLEPIRCMLHTPHVLPSGIPGPEKGWAAMTKLGGIPREEAVMLWGFPVHSNPVIELDPARGLVPQVVGDDEIRLAVNGTLDPATVKAFRVAEEVGPIYLIDFGALLANMPLAAFPRARASYAAGTLTIKTDQPLPKPGKFGIIVTRGVKDPAGKGLVPPPAVVLVTGQGTVANAAGRSLVSNVPDADAVVAEKSRLELAPLLGNDMFLGLTGIKREEIAFVYSFDRGP